MPERNSNRSTSGDVAHADAKLIHDLERDIKRALFLLRPFQMNDAGDSVKRAPEAQACQAAYQALTLALVRVERGLRDQLASPICVTLTDTGIYDPDQPPQ